MDGMNDLWQSSQLEGENAAYLEALYENYLDDPKSVTPQLRSYFDTLAGANTATEPRHSQIRQAFVDLAQKPKVFVNAASDVDPIKFNQVMNLVNSYRRLGHYVAKIDPLKMNPGKPQSDLSPSSHGLTDADLQKTFPIPNMPAKPLEMILADLRKIYCGSIGYEYAYIDDQNMREWLRSQIETPRPALTIDQKKWLLQRMMAADGLEKYLGTRYVGQKRFGLEGGDSLIPLMDKIILDACDGGTKEIAIAMAHRGRLNVLVNVMGMPPRDLFAGFEGKHRTDLIAGDVKYHNGYSSDVKTEGGMVHLALAYNPSHLEIVSPVVDGSIHARQYRRSLAQQEILAQDQVFAIHTHGDAAFAGQGCIYEMFNMAQTRGYGNGGAVHIVINNQVGFTTSNPLDARSTYYCTDIAKMFDIPVLHVNGDDPEAIWWVAELALRYRHTFKRDVVIDLVCYRRHGHNESDEPAATQPLMYQVIKALPAAWKLYAERLKAEGVVDDALLDTMQQDYKKSLEAGDPVRALVAPELNKKFISNWQPYFNQTWQAPYVSKVSVKDIQALGAALDHLPDHFTVQPQVEKTLQARAKMTTGETPINWGYAEIMAYATLVNQGINVRLSGEDCGRGTFAHRHVVLHDQKDDACYVPLDSVAKKEAKFVVIDSILSEEAVLAFEYGYAGSSPESLVLWEAQYGDFANGAQVVIDQFISSGEEKWGRLCGLVMLLPHGQQGEGPEHSSARLERFLQLCAHDNMQVCAPTTPAQIYHLLRRQVLRPLRIPLIIMSPKSLLRHPLVVSSLDDLANGEFHNVLPELDALAPKKIKRVVICQGKVYYDLLAKRREQKIENVAIIRLEQMYPFPKADMQEVLAAYAHVKDWVWCQEEGYNQGAWFKVVEDINPLLPKNCALQYVGEEAYASAAVGYPDVFQKHQAALVAKALAA